MQPTQRHREADAVTRKPSFLKWLPQQWLDDWQRLIVLANDEISTTASTAGIGWTALGP